MTVVTYQVDQIVQQVEDIKWDDQQFCLLPQMDELMVHDLLIDPEPGIFQKDEGEYRHSFNRKCWQMDDQGKFQGPFSLSGCKRYAAGFSR